MCVCGPEHAFVNTECMHSTGPLHKPSFERVLGYQSDTKDEILALLVIELQKVLWKVLRLVVLE